MNRIIAPLVLAIFALFASAAPAAIGAEAPPPFDPAAAAKAVAPFLDEQAILVAHVDLSRVDIDAAFDLFTRLLKQGDGKGPAKSRGTAPGGEDVMQTQLTQARTVAKTWIAQVQALGGRDIYVVGTLANVFQKDVLFAVMPLNDKAKPQQLLDMLSSAWGKEGGQIEEVRFEQVGAAIVFGPKATRDRLKTMKPASRPELSKAFAAAGDSAAQIAFIPNADTRRVIEELLPTLPREMGGGPSTALTRGALWAGLGLNLPPKMSFAAVAQAQDENSAKALAATVNAITRFLATSPEAQNKEITPFTGSLPKSINPIVAGDRVTLNWDEKQIETLLTQTVTPLLLAARDQARHAQTMSRVRMIVMACIQNSQAHKDQPPDSLQQLVEGKYLTPESLTNPIQPGRKVGFAYRKPAADAKAGDPQWVLVYEIADPGPGSAAVGYADGHIEMIRDEAEFRRLTAPAPGVAPGAATSQPVPPGRGP